MEEFVDVTIPMTMSEIKEHEEHITYLFRQKDRRIAELESVMRTAIALLDADGEIRLELKTLLEAVLEQADG